MTNANLPDVVSRYLDAHRDHDTSTALAQFSPGATVIDEGNTYTGASAIEDWLSRSASEYTFTIALIGTEELDSTHYIATHHLEGDFPGGTVDLRYQFTLADGLIQRRVIEP